MITLIICLRACTHVLFANASLPRLFRVFPFLVNPFHFRFIHYIYLTYVHRSPSFPCLFTCVWSLETFTSRTLDHRTEQVLGLGIKTFREAERGDPIRLLINNDSSIHLYDATGLASHLSLSHLSRITNISSNSTGIIMDIIRV